MTDLVLRRFSSEGVRKFKDLILGLGPDLGADIDMGWIFDQEISSEVEGPVFLHPILPHLKRDAANVLSATIADIEGSTKYYDQGLWAWMSAFYFDIVCPIDKSGHRTPGKEYRHIPASDRNWRNVYRHLLAAPVRIRDLHPDSGLVLLSGEVDKLGDFMEQIASRQELAGCRGVVEALDLLYWDPETRAPKPGARATRREPGGLRRFVDVIQQLQVTYDLFALSGEEILGLLPAAEFDRWRN